MPSIFSKLVGLFPSFRPNYAPNVPTREESAIELLRAERIKLEKARARPAPAGGEKVPRRTTVGGSDLGNRTWFLPYFDSATGDSPEIRAALRLMRTDAYVKSAWEPQVLAVESEDWQIQPTEPNNPDAEEQAEFVKRVFEDYTQGGMSAVARAVCAPLGSDGHSVAEKVWAPARKGALRGSIVLEKLPARDTDPYNGEIRLEGDSYGNVTHVVPVRGQYRDAAYSIRDFVYSKYLGVFNEPLGEAAYRPVYGPYWMRDTVRKLRVIHHEKRMAGMLMGTYQNDDDKPALDDALQKARAATWLSVPEGTRVEAIAISTASEPDYKSFDESLREEIVQGIAFATLQSLQGTVTDARGSAAMQKSMADLGPWLLMKIVTQAVNSQIIPDLIDFNFPYPAAGGYPKLTFGAVSNAELLELLQVVTGAQQIGLKPSRKYYAQALSIQEADDTDPDDALQPGGQQQPPMGGGMGGGFGGDPFGGGGFGGPPAPEAPQPPLPPESGAELPIDEPAGPETEFMTFADSAGERHMELPVPVWNAAEFFSEDVQPRHYFAWVQGKRSRYWLPAGKEDVPRNRRYGKRAEAAAARAGKGGGTATAAQPAPQQAPQPQPAPTAPQPQPQQQPAPTVQQGVTGAAGKTAGKLKAVGRGTLSVVKTGAKASAGVGRLIVGTVSRGGILLAQGIRLIGAGLKKLSWLERQTGIGSMLETMGRRKENQSRTNLKLAQSQQGLKAFGRQLKGAVKNFLAIQWEPNRRRFGAIGATIIETAFLALKFGPAAALSASVAGALGAGAASVGGAAVAGAWALNKVIGPVLSKSARFIAEKPFWLAAGTRKGLARPDRAAMRTGLKDRARGERRAYAPVFRAWKAEARKARRAGQPIPPRPLAPWEQREQDFNAKRGYEPTAFPEKRAAILPLGFAEEPEGEPFLDALRETVEGAFAAEGELPPEVPDEWYAQFAAGVMERVGRTLTERTAEFREAIAERIHRFGWTGARTRKQTVKAVGTGPDAGKTLYGKDALNALARGAGVGPRVKRDQRVEYDDPQQPPYTGAGPQKPVRAKVSAATARELAVKSALADADGDPLAPRNFRALGPVSKRAVKAVKPALEAALSGDQTAVNESGTAAARALAQVPPEAVAQPVSPAERGALKGMWEVAAKGLAKGDKKEVFDRLDGFMAGVVGAKSSDEIFDKTVAAANGFADWVRRRPAKVAGAVLSGLAKLFGGAMRLIGPAAVKVLGATARAGWGVTKGLARLGWGAAGRIGGELGDSIKEVLGFAARPLGRALRFVGGAGGALAIMGIGAALIGGAWAAPALALRAGLIAKSSETIGALLAIGFASLPLVVGGMRRVKRLAMRTMKWGVNGPQVEAAPPSVPGVFSERGQANVWGPPLSGSFRTFAWSDWKPQGDKMVSPGGRSLSRESFERLSKGAVGGKPAAPAKAAAAPDKAPESPKPPAGQSAAPDAPQPGRVYSVNPGAIAVDPERFQFKLNTNKTSGTTKELESVAVYDPELAGVLAVWRDPADGKTYVVNGHHRLELAKRAGAGAVDVRYLKAATAEEARAKGALINIAEVRGTAVDAAKFLRDTGRSPEDLAAVGVSLKGAVARDAVPLSKLSPTLFRRVTFGALDADRAIAVAKHLESGRDQEQLIAAIEKREASGKPVPTAVVEAMAREFRDAPRKGGTTDTLFGALEDDDSSYFARAELKAFLRNELAKEAKDFRLGASERRAAVLATRGNSLKTADNKTEAERAETALATFEARSTLKGELADLLNDYAVEYSNAGPAARNRLRTAALRAVRTLLSGGQPGPVESVGVRSAGLFE